MSFRTTLFQALRAADVVSCNAQPVIAKMLECPDGLLQPYVDLADRSTIYLDDSEIQIDGEGLAYAVSKNGKEPMVWRFSALKPLQASDVAVIQPDKLTIHHVVGRMKQLNG